MAWLASESAKDLTAQIIHVSRGSVGIMQQPAIIKAFKSEALWTQGQLDQLIPKLFEAKQANDARAQEGAKPEQG